MDRLEGRGMALHPAAMVFRQHPRTPWPGESGETLMWTSGWPVGFRALLQATAFD